MWRKIGRVVGVILGWGVILAYILYASHLAQMHRAEQKVEKIVISMSDSTATQLFATSEQVRRQLKRGGFKMENEAVDSIDAVRVSEYIARNGYVRDVDAYVTYAGSLHINVWQHEPIARLMCGGLNSYITAEGEVFRSPQGAAYYTAVITGEYKPIFTSRYEGSIRAYHTSLMDLEEAKLVELSEEFAALRRERSECVGRRLELRKRSKKGIFESSDNYQQRKVGLGVEIAKCDVQLKQLTSRRTKLEQQQQMLELRKKKLQKKYDDFVNLINFVSRVEADAFWSAEVVQFVADTTSMGDITLRLIPRSGDFVIEFGTLAENDVKLAKLREFYDEGLAHIGWNQYRIVDVRYNKQVICTE